MDLLALGLIIWSRVLLRRADAPKWLRWVTPVLLVGFVVSLGGTVLGLKWAFHAIDEVPPAQKSAVLAEGIARAMRFTIVGLALDAVTLVALLVVTFRRR